MLRSIVLSALCLMAPALARGQDAMCRNGGFVTENTAIALAKVAGAPRTFLRKDAAPCPNDTPACRGRAYVVPGDTVLTGDVRGDYVCALYPGKDGGSAGYVRRDEVVSRPVPSSPALSAWEGEWTDGDDTIVLKGRDGQLVAAGEAYWPSADPPLQEFPGGPNVGEMGGAAKPSGNVVTFSDEDPDGCRVKLTLLSPYLAAADNLACGGMNVTFTGVYRRK